MANVAYIRVSTVEQNTDRQLSDISVEFDKKFEDKASGKDTKRPQFQAMLEYVREGDTLYVHSIDRLGRSLQDLMETVKKLNNKGVTVKFHKENLEFSAERNNPMNDLMFNLLGSFAQFERAIARERQMEGIAKAKEKGVYNKERQKKVSYDEIYQKYLDSDIDGKKASYRQLAKELNVGHGTIERAINACKPTTT